MACRERLTLGSYPALQTSARTLVPAAPDLPLIPGCREGHRAEPWARGCGILGRTWGRAGHAAAPGLGCQWWGPASMGRMWWLQQMPFPCLSPSPWPREHGRWQSCPFCASGCTALSQETANCARWQSRSLPGSAPALGPVAPVPGWGHPCPCFLGLPAHCCGEGSPQPPVMPINTARRGVGCWPPAPLQCGNGAG